MLKDKIVLAIIPARGGSKSVPRKNIRLLGGKPLIAYTIKAALNSKYIDRVILSTDDEEIAEIAKKYGADVPFLRPAEFAQDNSSSLSVILHALDYVENNENYKVDIIVFLQPTSPFRTTENIDEGLEKIETCDAVTGVCEANQHPYFMMLRKGDDYIIPYLEMENRPLRRQDVPEIFRFTASLDIAKREYFDTVKTTDPVNPIFGGNVRGVFMDETNSLDINTEFDFQMAELLLSKLLSEGKEL